MRIHLHLIAKPCLLPVVISLMSMLIAHNLNAQVLIPYSGSNSISCGTNTTLCTHNGCGATYSSNANGYTVINSAGTAVITVSGSYYTESGFDYVRIYSGSGTSGTLLATYNGNSTFNYSGTAGQTLTVSFTSDGSVEYTGLNATVSFSGSCSTGVLIPYSGSNSIACGTNTTLCTHAGCGTTYSASANGYTVINAVGSAVITISGSYYTETNYDYVRIYSGLGTGGTLLATYHGNSTFNYTGTAGQTLTVSFTSDGSVQYTGLNATVTFSGSCSSEMTVPSSGNNSYTVCSGNLYDYGGSAADYGNSWNGYTVLNPSISGNMIQVSGTVAGESCCDYLYIYNGSGTGGTLLWSGVASTGTVPLTTSTSGPLTIQFTSDGSVVGAGFNLTVSCIAPFSLACGNTNLGAITPSCGNWQSAAYSAGTMPYWSFTATAGYSYQFSLCPHSGGTEDSYLHLYNSAGTQVWSADDNGIFSDCSASEASGTWTCTTSGTYYISATHYSCTNIYNAGSLRYMYFQAPFNSKGTITPTTSNQTSNYNAGEISYWTFSATSGNIYNFSFCSNSEDSYLRIYDNTWTQVTSADDNGPYCTGSAASIQWSCATSGTYYIVANHYSCSGWYNASYLQYSYTPPCTTPGTPVSVSGTATGQTTANLSWAAGSPAGSATVTYYWVVGTSSSVTYGSGVAQGTTTGTSASASGLSCGTTYYLRVYAYTSCNGTSSGYGTSSSFATSACCVTPGTPVSLSGSGTGYTTANISWSAGSPVGSATVTYYWNFYTSGGSLITSGNTTSTSTAVSGLTCGTSYYFAVYAYTSCNGTSSSSAISSTFSTSACVPPCGNTNLGTLYFSNCSPQDASYAAGTIAYWSFSATAGTTYNFTLGSNTEDSYLHLYNAAFTEVASNDDYGPFYAGTPSSLSYTCSSSGTYYITACHYSCSSFSNSGYMTYWSTSAPYGSSSLTSISPTATWQNQSYSNGSVYVYSFSATAGYLYDFSLCSNTEDSYLQIYNSTFDLEFSNDDNGSWCSGLPASASWSAPSSGTYYVQISHLACGGFNNSGNFAYRCIVPCTPTCGNTNLGTITPQTCTPSDASYSSGTIPYWKFFGTAGVTYNFSLGSNTEDSYLRVYDFNCAELASNDDNGPLVNGLAASLSFTCTSSGYYFVSASAYSCNSFSNSGYMTYWATNAGYGNSSLVSITPTTSWQNQAYTNGYLYLYQFTAVAGYVYDFSLCSNTEDSYIRIYNTTYDLLYSNDDNGPWCSGVPSSVSYTAPSTGSYIVEISHLGCSGLNNSGNLAYKTNHPVPVNDNCTAITPSSLSVGSTITFNGDNAGGATSDCSLLGWPEVWHAFTTTECSDLVIDFCSTTPVRDVGLVLTQCSCSSLTYYYDFNNYDCADGNYTMYFEDIPAGTYYYPVYSDGSSVGPYTLHVTANASMADPTAVGASPASYCIGASTTISATPGSEGDQVYWYTGGCGNTYVGTGTSLVVNPVVTTTYYARTYNSSSGCFGHGCTSVTVTVNVPTPSTPLASTDYVFGSVGTDWNTPANWLYWNGSSYTVPSSLPTTGNNVIITSSASCASISGAATSGTANCRNITIESGRSLSMTSQTLNVSGNWTNYGTFNCGTGTVNFSGTNQTLTGNTGFYYLRFAGSGIKTLTGGYTYQTTRTADAPFNDIDMIVNSGVTLSIPSGAILKNNNLYGIQISGTVNINGGTVQCAATNGNGSTSNDSWLSGSVLSMSSGILETTVSPGDADFTGATLNISGGSILINDDLWGTGTLNQSGGTIRNSTSGGAFIINGGSLTGGIINAYQYNDINRGLVIAANTTASGSHTTNILSSTSAYTPVVNAGVSARLGNVVVGAGSTLNLGSGASLSLAGSLTINTGITLVANNNNISIAGSWTNNGSFTPGTGTVIFNGTSGTSTITTGGTGAGKQFYNLTINSSNIVDINAVSVYNIQVNNNLTISAANQFNCNGNTMYIGGNWAKTGGQFNRGTGVVYLTGTGKVISGNETIFRNLNISGSYTLQATQLTAMRTSGAGGDITIASGGSLNCQSNSISLEGNWNNDGSFTAGTGLVRFNGSLQQSIQPGSSVFNNVVFINTTAGSADLNIGEPMVINGAATFTSGIAYFSGTGSLTFGSSATSNDGDDDSYVDGLVAKTGTTAFTFPVGDGIVWAPVRVSAPVSSATITAQYNFVAPELNWSAAYMCNESLMQYTSGVENWNLTTTGPTPSVTLYWKNGTRSGITNLSDLAVAHFNGSCWEYLEGSTAGNVSSGSITSTIPFTSYSPVSFGSKRRINPLPVELINFNATCNSGVVNINWQTASETNNEKFIIERSVNSVDFVEIGEVKGAGNSNVHNDYSYIDNYHDGGQRYYRLKQTDFNGKFEYSDIVVVTCKGNDEFSPELSAHPNPFNTELIVSGTNIPSESAMLIVEDVLGKAILSKDIPVNSGSFIVQLQMTDLPPAVYFIKVISQGYSKTIKVVKEQD